MTPIFKNKCRNHKNNYKLVSILPLLSKIFEKIIKKQLSMYLENIFSKFQCGFRKGFSTQHCLLLMHEKWKNGKMQLTHLSKTFDCIGHYLLIAKLNAYSLSLSALKLVHNYLHNYLLTGNNPEKVISELKDLNAQIIYLIYPKRNESSPQ